MLQKGTSGKLLVKKEMLSGEFSNFRDKVMREYSDWQTKTLDCMRKTQSTGTISSRDDLPHWVHYKNEPNLTSIKEEIDNIFRALFPDVMKCKNEIGYVAAVEPDRDKWSNFVLIGEWNEKQKKCWKDYNKTQKLISTGVLAKHLLRCKYEEVILFNWSDPNYRAGELNDLEWGWVISLPVLFKGKMIGALTYNFDSWESAKDVAPNIYYFASIFILPLLLPESLIMNESVVLQSAIKLWTPSVERIVDTSTNIENTIRQSTPKLISKKYLQIKNNLNKQINEIEKIKQEVISLSDYFNPELKQDSSKNRCTYGEFNEIVNKVKNTTIQKGDYHKMLKYVSIDKDNLKSDIFISSFHVERILHELICNGAQAIFDALHSNPLIRNENKRLGKFIELHGSNPIVRIKTYNEKKDGDIWNVIDIADNGIGMGSYLLQRSMDLGFTGRDGTGMGLTIVRITLELYSGLCEITSKPLHANSLRISPFSKNNSGISYNTVVRCLIPIKDNGVDK